MAAATNTYCGDCGAAMREYQLFDRDGEPDGTHLVCPNEWRANHP